MASGALCGIRTRGLHLERVASTPQLQQRKCGPYRIRTGDLLLDREASTPDCSNRPWSRRRGLHPRPPLYEGGALLAKLRRSGGGGGTRTRDLELMRLTSYQLLHTPVVHREGFEPSPPGLKGQ
jgi:hypothetical protein